ncbi:MAG: glycoside hydrolase [Clostridiaceae bacterium]|nr:glycoside hydrolase [Clostridiaceae bacterium]
MEFFKQNDEQTVPRLSPLVAENRFIAKTPDTDPLPVYEEVKDRLPSPVWDGHEDHIRCYWRTWQLAFGNLRRPLPGTGFVSSFIDTAFNGCEFMWDSSFILMFGKYADKIFRFQATLDNLYSHQHRDGFICREIEEETGRDRFTRHDPSATGPDIMPWCEWDYFHHFGDKERLSNVFPPLMAYHRWMAEHHTWPDGTYFSSGWGCGMDNLPRQMPGYSPEFSHGHMIWVDACMQALNSCHVLIEMANVLGRGEFIEELEVERDRLEKVINEKLWDEETGFYYDLWKNGKHNGVRHIGAFWALIAACATPERAERMIAYLQDEKEFKTPHRVPALSRSHEKYAAAGAYWCGGVWAPTNYMVLKGLDTYGKYGLSHEIGTEHLNAVVEVFKKHHTVYENYAPEWIDRGGPSKGTPARPDFVGWTGLVPISVLFEFVFGIKPEADKRKILWCVNLLERHGIEKYPFGVEGELTLVCQARKDANERPQITLRSNVPVELEIVWGNSEHRQSMILKS